MVRNLEELSGCDRVVWVDSIESNAAFQYERVKRIQSEVRNSRLDAVVIFRGGFSSGTTMLASHAILVTQSLDEGCTCKILKTRGDQDLLDNVFEITSLKKRMIEKLRDLD
jgi:hypothetical protein